MTKDPAHWLYRLAPDEWLSAARAELAAATLAFVSHERRKGVANARRAAGMALNAVLIVAPDETWGRSYMDHLRMLAADASAHEAVRAAATELVEAPLDGPRLVPLGGVDEGPIAAAGVLLEWAKERVGGLTQHAH